MRNEGEIRDILDKGYVFFDFAQYNDAMECFLRAMKLENQNEEAEWALNQVIQMIVPRYHFNMLNDRQRNEVYDNSIRKAVDANTTVLDVGTGSGLLSMMAARAGAKKIFACEMVRPIADVARTIVLSNGYTDRIKVISKKT